MDKLKIQTMKSNWITFLTLLVFTVLFSTFLTPLEHGNKRFNLFLFSIFMFLTYQMILNIIGLLIILILDYIFFDKQDLEHFFSIETMILLTVPLLFFIFAKDSNPFIMTIIVSICCSQYLRYKFISKKSNESTIR